MTLLVSRSIRIFSSHPAAQIQILPECGQLLDSIVIDDLTVIAIDVTCKHLQAQIPQHEQYATRNHKVHQNNRDQCFEMSHRHVGREIASNDDPGRADPFHQRQLGSSSKQWRTQYDRPDRDDPPQRRRHDGAPLRAHERAGGRRARRKRNRRRAGSLGLIACV